MLINDIRYALRSLRKSPGFTTAAVACLGLGIGASTAIFSIVNAVLLKPLPYRDSQNYARVYTEFRDEGFHKFWISPPEFREIQQRGQAWTQVEAWAVGGVSVEGGERPLRINTGYVSGGLMPMLGVTPQLGRLITPADDDAGVITALVLSNGFWKSAFGEDPHVIGRETLLDGGKAVIVGVMPADFDFPPGAVEAAEAWAPLQLTPQQMTQRGSHFLSLVAHLKPGMTLPWAGGDLRRIEREMGAQASRMFHTINPRDHRLAIYGFQAEIIGNVKSAMIMLLGAVAFFLLIACVNVANLLLARADSRRREIAVRKAMGAGNAHLLRQFAVDGLLLSGAGAGFGILLAWAGVRFIVSRDANTIPRIREAGIDIHVLLFAVAVSILTGLVFCLAPMLQSFRQPVSEALKASGARVSGSLRSNRFRAALVVSEVSLALVLLIGAGLLVRAFWKLQQVDAGMRPDHLLTARLSLTNQSFNDPERLRQFWVRLNDKLGDTPGIVSATLAAGLPPERRENDNTTDIENFVQQSGGPANNVAFYQSVGDKFFETIGARLVEGRFFDSRDGFGAPPVMIVNQAMAKTFWPGQSALGRHVRTFAHKEYSIVVGVVADIRNGGMSKAAGTELFQPARQPNNAAQDAYAIVRTKGNPELAAHAIQSAVAAIDPSVPVSRVRTMEDVMGASESQPRFLALMLSVFSSLALVLAAFGIYGVISYSVARRTSEFGIRMALGAGRGDVLRQVLGEGALLASLGVAAGYAGALMATRVLTDLLFQVSRFDTVTFLGMAGTLITVALAASWLPARRATAISPVQALRYE